MTKILITGGTGFFGKSLLDHFQRNKQFKGSQYTIVSRKASSFIRLYRDLDIKAIDSDVRDLKLEEDYDFIIHAATPASTSITDAEMKSIILEGTCNMIEQLRKHPLQKFLFTSSGAVYGPYDRAVSEDDICNPTTEYGKAKLEAERICLESGLDVTIARCFAFSGKNLNKDLHFAIGNFVRNAISNEDIVINGDGSSIRSYMDQEDLARWLIAQLQNAKKNSTYNIGSPYPISIKDLAFKVKETLNKDIDIKILNQNPDKNSKNVYLPNVDKFKNDFNESLRKTLKQSIIEMSIFK